MPEEPGATGRSITDLGLRIRSSDLVGIERTGPIASAVTPVLSLLEPLDRVSAAATADEARALLLAADGRAQATTVRFAWRRMGELGFPAGPSEFADAAQLLASEVLPRIAAVEPSQRREAIGEGLRAELKRMWLAVAHERTGPEPAAVDALFGAMDIAGVDEATIAQLEPWAKVNLARWRFIRRLEDFAPKAGKPKEQAQELAPIVRELDGSLAEIGGIDAVRARDGFQRLDRKLRPFREGKTLELDREGPARAGWSYEELDDIGAVAAYTLTVGRSTYRLLFDRVILDEANDIARYICRTEMPLGLFADLVIRSGPIGEIKGGDVGLLNDYGEDVYDARPGPLTWYWQGVRLVPSPPQRRLANGWHVNDTAMMDLSGQPFAYYPQGVNPEKPSTEHPMAYTSVQGATLAAFRAGCRLPTKEEWAAARTMQVGDVNVRDGLWGRQHTHIQGLQDRATGKAQWPNGGSYATAAAKNLEDAALVRAEPDGSLWTRPVPANPIAPVDVVGNVAEFVVEDPAPMDQALSDAFAANAEWTPARLRSMMRDLGGASRIGVIGGSALSGPGVPPEEVTKIDVSAARGLPYGYDPRGYSDVGVRLAFTTGVGAGGSGSPKARLLKLLRESPYLTRAD